MLLKPCVLCIYERCALFGVLGAALIGAIAPKTPLRYVAMVIWLYSAFRGVQLTYEHTMLQLYPSPFATCDFMVRFPEWLPLDKWVPAVNQNFALYNVVKAWLASSAIVAGSPARQNRVFLCPL